ncbi:MAG: peroxiredoxin [Limisphaerales bacterium]|jgi:peroxiredoxin
MSDYGVAFHLSKETVPKYFGFVVQKTRKANSNEEDVLPVPATFVISKDGKVKYKHFDTDYTKRASVATILNQL